MPLGIKIKVQSHKFLIILEGIIQKQEMTSLVALNTCLTYETAKAGRLL